MCGLVPIVPQSVSNLGDYQFDPVRFPSGFAFTAEKVRAAGLQVGLHIISPGASIQGTKVAMQHPELFVPQGLVTRDYYHLTDAGTWPAHEGQGAWAWDHSRQPDSNLPPSQQPPPGEALRLVNVSWSKLGRFRNGSALGFDGRSSYAVVHHAPEHDFNDTFSLQMVVHVGATWRAGGAGEGGHVAAAERVLACKSGAWCLWLDGAGRLQWEVRFRASTGGAGGVPVVVLAKGATPLTPDEPDGGARGPPSPSALPSSAFRTRIPACYPDRVETGH